MNVLIVGNGQIGKAIKRLEEEAKNKVFEVDKDTPKEYCKGVPKESFMHVSFPYDKHFVKETVKYIKKYGPSAVVIHSTVDVGTTSKIESHFPELPLAYSPVRGIHPNLYEGFKVFIKQFACALHNRKLFYEHLAELGIKSVDYNRVFENYELAKLLCTTQYAANLVIADYAKTLCDYYGCDYDKVYIDSNLIYNLGYEKLGMGFVRRPILTPPNTEEGLGGHCLIPNAVILHKRYPHQITKSILALGYKADKSNPDKKYSDKFRKKRFP